MLKKYDANLLSKYRNEMFGIGAIGVLIVHSINILDLNSFVLDYILGLGGVGVYMFAFLSGIGLYFSVRGGIIKILLQKTFYTGFDALFSNCRSMVFD